MKISIKLPEKKTIAVSNFKSIVGKFKNPETDTTSITTSITSTHLLKN